MLDGAAQVVGKTRRRSHDRHNGLGALQSVSVWATDFGLTLGQVATDEKSNEITAIADLLRLVVIEGAIITIDAMGTQTAIAEQFIEANADYVLALKGNQGTLHQAVIDYVDEQMERDFTDAGARRHGTQEKGHGREEARPSSTAVVLLPPSSVGGLRCFPKNLPGLRMRAEIS